MAGPWKFVLFDEGGAQRGLLKPAAGVQMTYVRNVPAGMSFAFDGDHRLARYIVEGRSKVKAYRNGILRGFFRVCPADDDFFPTNNVVSVTAAGPMWMLGRRSLQADAVFTSQDQGQIAKQLIDTQNARYPTGIDTGVYVLPATTTRTLTIPRDKFVLPAIGEMSNAYDGFDFDTLPVDADPLTSDIMGALAIWQQRGVDNQTVIWKQDTTGCNIMGLKVTNAIDRLTTHQHLTGRADGASIPRSDPAADAAMVAAYRAIYDSVDSIGDVAEQALLDAAALKFQSWRSMPRRVVSFMPDPAAARYFAPWDDYDIGDRVTFRLKAGRYTGTRAIDAAVRVYGWTIDVDGPTGDERVTSLVLEPNDAAGDS